MIVVAVRWEVLTGEPSRGIVELARSTFSTMLALAHPPSTGAASWLDAGLVKELIKETGDPVLVVPSG